VLIETPEQVFAEYTAHTKAARTGRILHHLFAGRLVAKKGKITLLRESLRSSQGQKVPPYSPYAPKRWGPKSVTLQGQRARALKKEVAFQKKVSFWKPVQRGFDWPGAAGVLFSWSLGQYKRRYIN
jgi:hypothetical protein